MSKEKPKFLILNYLDMDFKLKDLGEEYAEIKLHELDTSNTADVVAIVPSFESNLSFETHVKTLPNLKVIAIPGSGYDHINIELAKSRGIRVGNTPHAFSVETAELALTLLLALNKKLLQAISTQKCLSETPTPIDEIAKFRSVPLSGSKLGIVGLGHVGFEVAKRARGFDMSILYHNRKQRPDESEVGAEYFSQLQLMLPLCDFLVLTVRASDETVHMVGKYELALLKPTCILINVARSSVIDQTALVVALMEGRLGGAGLDVKDPDILPPDHELLNLENVIVTPHIGWVGERGFNVLCQEIADNIRAGVEGKPLPHPVGST